MLFIQIDYCSERLTLEKFEIIFLKFKMYFFFLFFYIIINLQYMFLKNVICKLAQRHTCFIQLFVPAVSSNPNYKWHLGDLPAAWEYQGPANGECFFTSTFCLAGRLFLSWCISLLNSPLKTRDTIRSITCIVLQVHYKI